MYRGSCSYGAHSHLHFLCLTSDHHFLGASCPSGQNVVCSIFSLLKQTPDFCWALSAGLLPHFLQLSVYSVFLKCLLFQLGLEFLTTNYFSCFEIHFLLLWLKEALGYCIIYENWILDSDKLCVYTCTKHKHIKYIYLVVLHCICVHVSMKWSVLHHYPFSRQLIKLSLQLV